MNPSTTKHIFSGANTPEGFFSYQNYVLPTATTHLFILTGGPFIGQVILLKKIGDELLRLNYTLEYHHCSNDDSLLDGLTIPSLQITFICDSPSYSINHKKSIFTREVLNLQDLLSSPKLPVLHPQLVEVTQEMQSHLRRAYHILRGSKAFYDDWKTTNGDALNYVMANEKTSEILTTIFSEIPTSGTGNLRKLFASAITACGLINHVPSIIDTMPKQYILRGAPGTGKSTLLEKIMNTAISKGLDLEAYYCPLAPQKIEHLLIPQLGLAITTSSPPHLYTKAGTHSLNMNDCLDSTRLIKSEEFIIYDRNTFWTLLNTAVSHLNKAKMLQAELDTYWVPSLDYGKIDHLATEIIHRLVTYKKEKNFPSINNNY